MPLSQRCSMAVLLALILFSSPLMMCGAQRFQLRNSGTCESASSKGSCRAIVDHAVCTEAIRSLFALNVLPMIESEQDFPKGCYWLIFNGVLMGQHYFNEAAEKAVAECSSWSQCLCVCEPASHATWQPTPPPPSVSLKIGGLCSDVDGCTVISDEVRARVCV